MKENERKWRKWRKIKENERKWKKMKENERKWKKIKEKERTWRKIKENERKWKKWKKWKKTEKMKKNVEKRKKFIKNGFTRKILDDFHCLPLLLWLFFVKILNDFHDFVSECVSFPKKINNPFWVVTVFPKKSDKFHWTWNKNTHFSDENRRKKIAKVSPSNNNYSFRMT